MNEYSTTSWSQALCAAHLRPGKSNDNKTSNYYSVDRTWPLL